MRLELNIFVAGSKALEKERDLFRIEAQNIQVKYKNNGVDVRINIITYESFSIIMSPGTNPQDVYNDYIGKTADIVFFILDGNIGGITRLEYDTAEASFLSKNSNKPVMGVFYKEGEKRNSDIEYIKKQIDKLHQYWCDYKNIDNLKSLIRACLEQEIDKRLRKLRKSIFITTIVIITVISVLAWAISNTPTSKSDDNIKINAQQEVNVVPIIDNLALDGQLKIDAPSGTIVKYCLKDILGNTIEGTIENSCVLYPKTNCSITIYGYKENEKLYEYEYNFNFCKFIETAIKSKKFNLVKNLFNNRVELILSNDMMDVSTEPITDIYGYLQMAYSIASVSVEDGDLSKDLFHCKYPLIKSVKLIK